MKGNMHLLVPWAAFFASRWASELLALTLDKRDIERVAVVVYLVIAQLGCVLTSDLSTCFADGVSVAATASLLACASATAGLSVVELIFSVHTAVTLTRFARTQRDFSHCNTR